MSEAASLRRYYLLERLALTQIDSLAMAAVFRAKQEAAPAGTPLPTTFPNQARLVAVGYEASEDLIGADCYELADYADLNTREAQDVLAALAVL